MEAGNDAWEALFDQVPDAAFILNDQADILSENKVATRLSKEEGWNLRGLPRDWVAPQAGSAIHELSNGRSVRVSWGPLGEGQQFLLIEDLSDSLAVDQRRRDFVANASHELQTPIAALVGLLDLMEGGEDRAYVKRLLKRAQRKAEDLSALTRDLIGLAKAEDVNWQPRLEPVELRSLVEGVVERFADKAEERGLTVELEAGPEVPLVMNPAALETVVSNLIDNGLSYTQEGGVKICIQKGPNDGGVLTVRDTGQGIDPEMLNRVFERFFRGDPARSRETGGTGLGLSIVRNLMGHLGGRVSAWSQEGEGSEFKIELPRDATQPLAGAGQAGR
ncbi:MAG: HAMP domain-containing histidine kinase [Planctomycetes bacterium]|nr:HAMP domain-containing histidine kinase [Planctomycetota bacterium]